MTVMLAKAEAEGLQVRVLPQKFSNLQGALINKMLKRAWHVAQCTCPGIVDPAI